MSEPLTRAIKPLGHKSYGSICHLPGSRMGPADRSLNLGQARILTDRARDRHDRIIVQEKLDGSNVSVARVDGILVPLIRAGYPAVASRYEQHRLFASWVCERLAAFEWLDEGERVCGEWLAQAHGTRYALPHGPFVAFDIMRNGHERATLQELQDRTAAYIDQIELPAVVGEGPMPVAEAMRRLGEFGRHGATDPIEGAVWRVERQGRVDFLGKYVRPDKRDGCYLPELAGCDPVWNWRPSK